MAREEHDEEHENHDHEALAYAGSRAEDSVLTTLKKAHPKLAATLEMSAKWSELDEPAKQKLANLQTEVERTDKWMPGYHAEGDTCAGCSKPTTPLFHDAFAEGKELAYAAFLYDLPVHVDDKCLEATRARFPRPAPQLLDKARRAHMSIGSRPSARITQFFRHDLFAHPAFGLEDWANSVAEANEGFDRAGKRDIERLLVWVHQRVQH